MQLTDEMVELAIKNNRKCLLYDDNYVLLYKAFPVQDKEVEDYIKSVKELKEEGVNTPLILDYHVVKNSEFGYSKVVILEERAKGTNLNSKDIYISLKQDNTDFNKISNEYLEALDFYINELENRASAKDDFYDKFLSDYMIINNKGLQVDPKPLNFYFERITGFIFIDINGKGNNDLQYLPRYFLGAILGYGLPYLTIHNTCCMYIDNNRLNRLKKAYESIIAKTIISLEKYGYQKDNIIKDAINWTNQINRLKVVDTLDDLNTKLQEDFKQITLEENNKSMNVQDDDWTIGW